jgi:hypothetical protein
VRGEVHRWHALGPRGIGAKAGTTHGNGGPNRTKRAKDADATVSTSRGNNPNTKVNPKENNVR